MVEFRGLTVTVNVDGTPLPEFEIPPDAQPASMKKGQVIMRYVEATAGKVFTIEHAGDPQATGLRKYGGISSEVAIDGQVQSRQMGLRADNFAASIVGRDHVKNGGSYALPFVFSKLDLNHDVKVTKTKNHNLDKLGLIEVTVRRYVSATKTTTDPPSDTSLVKKCSIHETQLKGLAKTLTTTYGVAEKLSCEKWNLSHLDSAQKPYARFLFFYHSRASLQILGAIPHDREPSPDLPLEERDPDDLSHTNAIALVKLLKDENKKLKQAVSKIEHFRRMLNLEIGVHIKREAPDDNDDEIPTVEMARPAKRRFAHGETIELDD